MVFFITMKGGNNVDATDRNLPLPPLKHVKLLVEYPTPEDLNYDHFLP